MTQTVVVPGGQNEEELRQSVQNALDQFISEERHQQ